MILFLLILGSYELCQVTGWDLGGGHAGGGGHSFGAISLDHNTHGNGLSFGEIMLDHNSKYSLGQWDLGDTHSWNQISGSSDEKTPVKGLEAWLTDVVIGKDSTGYIKPVIKEIGYPVYKQAEIKIPYPQVQHVPQPYPILIPMLHPVPYEVIKTVVKTVEKKVPTAVEKIVPVPVEKPVPFEVVKHVPVLVEKKFPIRIPVYKTIHHKVH